MFGGECVYKFSDTYVLCGPASNISGGIGCTDKKYTYCPGHDQRSTTITTTATSTVYTVSAQANEVTDDDSAGAAIGAVLAVISVLGIIVLYRRRAKNTLRQEQTRDGRSVIRRGVEAAATADEGMEFLTALRAKQDNSHVFDGSDGDCNAHVEPGQIEKDDGYLDFSDTNRLGHGAIYQNVAFDSTALHQDLYDVPEFAKEDTYEVPELAHEDTYEVPERASNKMPDQRTERGHGEVTDVVAPEAPAPPARTTNELNAHRSPANGVSPASSSIELRDQIPALVHGRSTSLVDDVFDIYTEPVPLAEQALLARQNEVLKLSMGLERKIEWVLERRNLVDRCSAVLGMEYSGLLLEDFEDVCRKGWLVKKPPKGGKLLAKAQRRFFVLSTGSAIYYAGVNQDDGEGFGLKGTIVLSEGTAVFVEDTVITLKVPKREWVLVAPDSTSASAWAEAFRQSILSSSEGREAQLLDQPTYADFGSTAFREQRPSVAIDDEVYTVPAPEDLARKFNKVTRNSIC